jgi:hypothetical protein
MRLWPALGWSWGVVGAAPAVFESADEPVLDLGGDVAVGLDEPVRQVMAKSPCLGDFGDVVGDEPGLVTVPQPVECEARSDRHGAFLGVAVDGGAEDPPVEGAPTQWMTVDAGEHKLVVGGGEVHLKESCEEPGQGDGAGCGRCLGRAKPEPVRGFMQSVGVRVDGDGPLAGVDAVALKAGEFAPAAAGPGCGDDQ